MAFVCDPGSLLASLTGACFCRLPEIINSSFADCLPTIPERPSPLDLSKTQQYPIPLSEYPCLFQSILSFGKACDQFYLVWVTVNSSDVIFLQPLRTLWDSKKPWFLQLCNVRIIIKNTRKQNQPTKLDTVRLIVIWLKRFTCALGLGFFSCADKVNTQVINFKCIFMSK